MTQVKGIFWRQDNTIDVAKKKSAVKLTRADIESTLNSTLSLQHDITWKPDNSIVTTINTTSMQQEHFKGTEFLIATDNSYILIKKDDWELNIQD